MKIKHKVDIWTFNKETNFNTIITSIEIDEWDIEKLAVSKYLENHTEDEQLIYSGNLFKTIMV